MFHPLVLGVALITMFGIWLIRLFVWLLGSDFCHVGCWDDPPVFGIGFINLCLVLGRFCCIWLILLRLVLGSSSCFLCSAVHCVIDVWLILTCFGLALPLGNGFGVIVPYLVLDWVLLIWFMLLGLAISQMPCVWYWVHAFVLGVELITVFGIWPIPVFVCCWVHCGVFSAGLILLCLILGLSWQVWCWGDPPLFGLGFILLCLVSSKFCCTWLILPYLSLS